VPRLLRSPLPSLLVLGLVVVAPAQGWAAPAQGWSVTPTQLAPDTEIRLDGSLDEPVWQTAATLGRLRVVEPREMGASVGTEVRLAYDRRFLYVALRCEEAPGQVRGRLMARDARLDPDDRVEVWFDTFGTGVFAYWFQIGAGGSRGDAQISDYGFRFNKSWDGIWNAAARVTPQGWVAELALPFQTLAFAPGADWGFNLRRLRKNGEEEHRWANPSQAYSFFRLALGGKLLGLTGIQQGVGLDIVPYAKGQLAADRAVRDHVSRTFDAGGEIFYRLSPALSFAATYNTDFAETEVDERQINLTRFPLFFPEKRDFFLDDAPLFEFGIPAGFGSAIGSAQVLPFFSRRIGLDSAGRAVPLLGGTKLTGRAGAWNIGLLQTVIDARADQPEEGVGVARVGYNVGREASVGVIGTLGDPGARGQSSTFGVDTKLGASDLFGPGRAGHLWLYGLGTQGEAAGGDGEAFGAKAEFTTAAWRHAVQVQGIEPGFAPRLGFVRRTDVVDTASEHGFTWRSGDGGWLRRVESRLTPRYTSRYGGAKDSYSVPWTVLRLANNGEDELSYRVAHDFERVPQRFILRDAIGVDAGDYSTTRHRFEFRSREARALGLAGAYEFGEFYTGDIERLEIEPSAYLSRYVQLRARYQEVRVRLAVDRFTTRIVEGRVDLTFSPDLSWRNLVQFDNDSDNLTVQSRLHWIPRPGTDVFLLAVYGWLQDPLDGGFAPGNQTLTTKLVHAFRF
jgi:hypothetical protein